MLSTKDFQCTRHVRNLRRNKLVATCCVLRNIKKWTYLSWDVKWETPVMYAECSVRK